MRGEWIEMIEENKDKAFEESLPMRGEWIEIFHPRGGGDFVRVSPHAGRVD